MINIKFKSKKSGHLNIITPTIEQRNNTNKL